jgi:anti-anti-sigma factor
VLRTSGLAAGVVVVSVTGDIDLATRAELANGLSRAITDPDLRLLIVDLTRVGFLACTGVTTLSDLRSDLAGRGVALRVVATDPVVLRVLNVTAQRELLGVRPHLGAALAGFLPTRTDYRVINTPTRLCRGPAPDHP